MNTSAPASAPFRSPLYFAALVFSAIQRSSGESPSRSRWMTPAMSATIVSFTPAAISSLRIAVPAAPAPDSTTRTSLMSLLDHPQRVEERGQHDDRRTVLVVVEDRDVQLLAQPGLDLEAARRGDVLQVDAGEPGRDRLDHLDDLLGVLGVQAERPGVDAGEPLEQRGLALHHRQRGLRADVAEAEHGGAVGDDRDAVALDRQPAGVVGVGRDRQADPRDTRACRSSTGRRGCGSGAWPPSRSCRRGASGRSGRRPGAISTPGTARIASTSRPACSVSAAAQVTSIRSRSWPEAVTSRAVTRPPACSTAVVSLLTVEPPAGTSRRTVME